MRTKIRNYVNGSTVERTFRAGISVNIFFVLVSEFLTNDTVFEL